MEFKDDPNDPVAKEKHFFFTADQELAIKATQQQWLSSQPELGARTDFALPGFHSSLPPVGFALLERKFLVTTIRHLNLVVLDQYKPSCPNFFTYDNLLISENNVISDRRIRGYFV